MLFPLSSRYMYQPVGCPLESCGIDVGPAIAGALAGIFLPFPYIFYAKGATIRKKCKFSAEADNFLQGMVQQKGTLLLCCIQDHYYFYLAVAVLCTPVVSAWEGICHRSPVLHSAAMTLLGSQPNHRVSFVCLRSIV
jgi:hypothetical protein